MVGVWVVWGGVVGGGGVVGLVVMGCDVAWEEKTAKIKYVFEAGGQASA